MDQELYVSTRHGLVTAKKGKDGFSVVASSLEASEVTCLIAREGVILSGTRDGIFRSDDRARTFTSASSGLSIKHIRWMAFHPDISDLEFAGTEPADIFVSENGGDTWRECREVASLRDRFKWFLPYSPEAGCIRGFAFNGSRAYAAAEVGGALRSEDTGRTWSLADGSTGDPSLDTPPAPFIYPDVHSIIVHPRHADRVYAPTGGGMYVSKDGSATWSNVYDCYCRATWVDPSDPEHMILGPADGVSRNGRIEESSDNGKNWRAASRGLNVPWPDFMVERFIPIEDELFAVLSNGMLYVSKLGMLEWTRILDDVEDITCVTAMHD